MTLDTLLFYAYLTFVVFLGGGAMLFIFRRRLARRDEVWRSLNLKLLRITFPRSHPPEGGHSIAQIREAISTMEKVYSGLSAVRDSGWRTLLSGPPSFALELAVPHLGEETTFYVAVPRRLSLSVEQMIQGVYPEAQVEAAGDYNIFNPDGASAAASLLLKRSQLLPIRTYHELEADPLGELVNAFSKIGRIGEGAAIQVVARPAPKEWGSRIMGHSRLVYQGKSPLIPKSFIGESASVLAGLATAGAAKDKDREHSPPEHRLSPNEEEHVRRLESKGSHPLFEANIRIVASAQTSQRAGEILDGIASAFQQFRDPGLNEFALARASGGRQLTRTLYQFSFRIFDPAGAAILSSPELASVFHFPNAALQAVKLAAAKAREAPPPPNLPETGVVLGLSRYRGEEREIRIGEDDRRRHLYLIGQTGTGKSALMLAMIRQDILAGRGVCFIDPHGQTVEEVLGYVPSERAGDVIYFNPGDTERPLGLNMLEYDPSSPEQKTLVVNELFAIFQKLYGAVPEALGPMFEQYFRNATLLVMDDPPSGSTLLEIERVFVDKAFRDLKLSRSKNVVVQTFWRDVAEKAGGESALANMVPYITSKFDTFLANDIMRPIIAQERSSLNFRAAMDEGKILLINLSKGRLGELNSALIGLIVVGKLLLSALSRTDLAETERRDFYCYIDEFQSVTTRSIATILSEARKYRLNLTIAHQFLGQLDEEIKKAVFGNVGSLVAFRVGADDAEFLAKQFEPVFSPSDLLNIDNHNAYAKLLINGQTSQPFNLRTKPPRPGDPEGAESVRVLSRMTYGRPRVAIEAEINRRYHRGG